MNSKTVISRHLESIADLLEFNGENVFKVNAYRNAANIIRRLSNTPEELIATGDLVKTKGIGKGIYQTILDYLERGTSSTFVELKKDLPDSFFELFLVRGLGPKKINLLFAALNVMSLTDLESACLTHKVKTIKGFTGNSEENILEEISRIRRSGNFIHIHHALEIRDIVIGFLGSIPGVIRCTETGDLRRIREVYNMAEFILLTSNVDEVLDMISQRYQYEYSGGVIEIHDFLITVKIYVTLSIADFDEKNSDILFRDISDRSGFDKSVLSPETIETEYHAQKEIKEAAFHSDLGHDTMKGLFHFHTIWSDGVHSLTQMIEYGQKLGYTYFAVCDHSKTASYAGGLTEDKVLMQKEEILRIREESGSVLLHGIESDILTDGSLDFPDDFLLNFDLIVASVHSYFNMNEEEMTKRIIRAVEHPRTNILGHPTGRILLRRDAYSVNVRKVIDACAANCTAIEINANPLRLDLDWRWIPYARSKGCLFSINADAHSADDIELTRYGIMIGRKGGLLESEVINYFELNKLKRFLSKED